MASHDNQLVQGITFKPGEIGEEVPRHGVLRTDDTIYRQRRNQTDRQIFPGYKKIVATIRKA